MTHNNGDHTHTVPFVYQSADSDLRNYNVDPVQQSRSLKLW